MCCAARIEDIGPNAKRGLCLESSGNGLNGCCVVLCLACLLSLAEQPHPCRLALGYAIGARTGKQG